MGFPSGTRGKEPICQSRRHKRHRFNLWLTIKPENIDKFLHRWIFLWHANSMCFSFFGLFCFGEKIRGRSREATCHRGLYRRHQAKRRSGTPYSLQCFTSALNYALLMQGNTLNISWNVTNRVVHYHIISVSHLL